MEELEKPRQAYIFQRGIYKNRGENVNPATPAVLPPMAKGAPRNRLGLAQWLVSSQHPLTARVLVNRIWKQYFGVGIVKTAEDFGIRGELPTHPELLDYLATELVDSKWDLKKLHRRIVLSATYRQASTTSKAKLDRDPENLLLARGPRLRLTAEMVRDNALAVSGLLVEKIGGESVKPVQPKNAWKTVGDLPNVYRRNHDEQQYRRALYVYWKRGSPYPSMLNFDAVKRDSCTVSRATTTTPVQALTLLNDPVYVECAKMLGQRMLKDREALRRTRDLKKPEEDAKRLAYGFRLCTSRKPSEQEVQILRKLLDEQRAHFKADAAAAKKLLSVGDAKIDETLDAAEIGGVGVRRQRADQSRCHDPPLTSSGLLPPRHEADQTTFPVPEVTAMNETSRGPQHRHRNLLARRAFLSTSVLGLRLDRAFEPDGSKRIGQRGRWSGSASDTPAYQARECNRAARHHDFCGGRPLAARPLRRETAAQQTPRRGATRLGAPGASASPESPKNRGAAGGRFVFQVQDVRQERPLHFRALPGDGCVCRRHLPGALDADGPRAA